MRYILVLLALAYAVPAQAQHETHRGSGDDVVQITKPAPDGPALLVVEGNEAGRYFSVTGYGDDGTRTGLLVSTTERYAGVVAVDMPPRTHTTLLEISATGRWVVRVYAMDDAPVVEVPGAFEGNGDAVLTIGGNAGTARTAGNGTGSYFAVTAYGAAGDRLRLLTSTTDPYEGTVLVPNGTRYLMVSARGPWRVELR